MSPSRPAPMALIGLAAAVALSGCSSSDKTHRVRTGPEQPPQGVQTLDLSSSQPDSTSAPSTTALPDACALLTKKEAERLAGVHMQAPDDTVARDPATDIGSCTYDAVFTGPSGQVGIFVQRGTPHALAVDKAIHHRFRSIAGIADQALEEPDNQSIFIRKGQTWIYVQASNTTPAGLERAARTIAARLP